VPFDELIINMNITLNVDGLSIDIDIDSGKIGNAVKICNIAENKQTNAKKLNYVFTTPCRVYLCLSISCNVIDEI
jgi:hypothetical protein